MTLRVGASFNPAIEAEGFLACSFCCSRDEGASCPLLRLTLAGCCLIRMWGWGGVNALRMPTGAPPPHSPRLTFSYLHVAKICLWWGLPPAPFVFKHCFQNWNFWVTFSVIGTWKPASGHLGALGQEFFLLEFPQGFGNDLDLMCVPWTTLSSHVPSSQFHVFHDLAFCPLSSGFIEG